ncbi:MAG TPA: hypothetical protein VMH34_04695 [Gammaproteobacteria bacterium]|nr:hypothetical protein [Gammaproteobacteria bacterium]
MATSNIPFDRALALEISAILILKALLLFFIWRLWFFHPQIEEMTLPADRVSERLFTVPPHPDHTAP